MKLLAILLLTIPLLSCSKADLSQYQDNEPVFSLFDYFQGKTTGWGMVQDRKGNLTRRFVVDIRGTVNGDNLTLDEDFDWNDGEKSSRTWTITKTGKHGFTGTADDVVGGATGASYGNVMNLRYYLNIVADGKTWKVHLDDWMFLQNDNVVINKAKMSKFGISLGDITIVFHKDGARG
jgi:hypothetical protein